jgi:hypothetical protein
LANDGGAEVTALDAIGYNLMPQGSATPEPTSLVLFGIGLAGMLGSARRSGRGLGVRKNTIALGWPSKERSPLGTILGTSDPVLFDAALSG